MKFGERRKILLVYFMNNKLIINYKRREVFSNFFYFLLGSDNIIRIMGFQRREVDELIQNRIKMNDKIFREIVGIKPNVDAIFNKSLS